MRREISRTSIQQRICIICGQKVMLDSHLAGLYGVSTGQLNRAVLRNIDRFPADFMFQMCVEEHRSLRCQIGILERGRHSKYLPRVFTEQGVAMLSSVLHSKRAVHVNIVIMRAFVKLRQMIAGNKSLARHLNELEKKYDAQFEVVFDAIRKLMDPPAKPKPQIGFKPQ